MGTRGMGSTNELLGSVAREVVNLADVPVTLVK
jgi:nucleotide-binding universal stress UspA family protein